MKVEQPPRITQTVSVSSPPLPPRPSYSTESTLVSPYAPTFPRLSRFFTWLWDWIRSFFQSPEKPKPAPAPSPAALQAIQIAQAEKEAASESWLDTPTLGIGLLGVSLCYWQWERVYPIATADSRQNHGDSWRSLVDGSEHDRNCGQFRAQFQNRAESSPISASCYSWMDDQRGKPYRRFRCCLVHFRLSRISNGTSLFRIFEQIDIPGHSIDGCPLCL